nr:hypothetical protein [uncultured Flavobacterium sp.]
MKTENITSEKIEKIILEKYTGSFMNNSKWVKLIQKIVENFDVIKKCTVKLIYDDEIRLLNITGDEQYDFDFYSNSMEGMLANPIVPGWTVYKEIEWISFPYDTDVVQDILKIKQQIQMLGEFNDELTDSYYRIYAYK